MVTGTSAGAINVNTFAKKDLCDLYLEPEGLKKFGGFDFSNANEIFNIGYEYGKSATLKINALF